MLHTQTLHQAVLTKPVAARARPAPSPFRIDAWVLGLFVTLPVFLTLLHLPYYLSARGARLRSPEHDLLKPSAHVGLALGIVGLALFLFMWLYPIRKKIRALSWTGSLGSWMRVHIIAGLSIPLIVAVHAGWRFEGLIGLGYLSMIVVCISGVVGRYLYTRIPRSRNGLELTLEEVAGERRALLTDIAAATGLDPSDVERQLAIDPRPYAGLDPLRTIVRMVQDDMARARVMRALRHEWAGARRGENRASLDHTLRLARRELALRQQVRMLEASRRVFGYWHVAHRPFAVTALIAVLAHVVVAVFVGGIGQ